MPQFKLRKQTKKTFCPACGADAKSRKTFRIYSDENGNTLSDLVGRCDRDSSCGYDFKPYDFLQKNKGFKLDKSRPNVTPNPKPKSNSHPSKLVLSNLEKIPYLPDVNSPELIFKYRLSQTKKGGLIYWQINEDGKIKGGKVMYYDSEGNRKKDEEYRQNWIHWLLKNRNDCGVVGQHFVLEQCLFGLHLLPKFTEKGGNTVMIVESEKTAVIMDYLTGGNMLWLSCGALYGLENEGANKLEVIHEWKRSGTPTEKRCVFLLPDSAEKAQNHWRIKANRFGFGILTVSELTGINDPEDGSDIADYLEIMDDVLKVINEKNK